LTEKKNLQLGAAGADTISSQKPGPGFHASMHHSTAPAAAAKKFPSKIPAITWLLSASSSVTAAAADREDFRHVIASV
jgi:hypothetical protein